MQRAVTAVVVAVVGAVLPLLTEESICAQAQEGVDARSAALLGSPQVISREHPAPDLIRLPAEWQEQFKAIAARSNALQIEVGTCLAHQFEQARSQGCSAAIGSGLPGLACSHSSWIVGPMQPGHPLSIDLTHAICPGTTVGDVHAHPRMRNAFFTYYLPSDTDVIRRKLSRLGWLSAVVNDDGVCVVLNGQEPTPDEHEPSSATGERLYGQLFAALLSGTPDDTAPAVDVDHFETSWVGQAYADRMGRVVSGPSGGGGALYCGPFGAPLRRHAEPNEAALRRQDSAIAQVAAKAAVIVARWLYHPQWAPIDFAWSDQEDPAFRRYLMRLAASAQLGSPTPASAGLEPHQVGYPEEAHATALLQLLWPLLKDPSTGRPPALSFWSFRAPRESRAAPGVRSRAAFLVARAPRGWTYQIEGVDEQTGQWRTLAQAWPGRGKYFLVQRDGAGFRLHEENATYTYDGEAVAAGDTWERTGQGVLMVGATRYVGSFDHGQMHGPGTMEGDTYRYEGLFDHNRPVGPGRLFVKETKSWHDVP